MKLSALEVFRSVTEWEVRASKSEELISIPVNKSNWIQDEACWNNALDGEGNVLLLWQAAQIDLRKWNTYSIWQQIEGRGVRKTEIIMVITFSFFLRNLTEWETQLSFDKKWSQTDNFFYSLIKEQQGSANWLTDIWGCFYPGAWNTAGRLVTASVFEPFFICQALFNINMPFTDIPSTVIFWHQNHTVKITVPCDLWRKSTTAYCWVNHSSI